MDRTVDNFYKIGTKQGVINCLYTRNQIAPCKTKFLDKNDVPDDTITVRTANKVGSKFEGQGFVKCDCTTKCIFNRCRCKKKKILCNSKFHNSSSCCNK